MRGAVALIALVACKSESKVVAKQEPAPVPIVLDAAAPIASPSHGRMGPVYRGVVKQLSVGTDHACVITADDTIACWSDSDPTFELGDVPKGTFRSVYVGLSSTCAQKTDGEVVCIGSPRLKRRVPTGSVDEMCNDNAVCVRKPDGSAVCYDDDGDVSLGVIRPESLACGSSYSCALAIDGTIRCGVIDQVMALGNENAIGIDDWSPPKTPVERVFAGYQHACAMNVDHTVVCWGRDVSGETAAPKGEFTTLSLGEKLSCGLRPGGSIECWGSDPGGPWPGPFVALGVTTNRDASNSVCAIRADHTVACWNYEEATGQ